MREPWGALGKEVTAYVQQQPVYAFVALLLKNRQYFRLARATSEMDMCKRSIKSPFLHHRLVQGKMQIVTLYLFRPILLPCLPGSLISRCLGP